MLSIVLFKCGVPIWKRRPSVDGASEVRGSGAVVVVDSNGERDQGE